MGGIPGASIMLVILRSHWCRRPHRLLVTALAIVALSAAGASAQTIDTGTYRVSIQGHPVGTELFFFELLGDSIVVSSSVRHAVQTPTGPDSLMKSAVLYASKMDLDLRFYQSNEQVGKTKKTRGLVMADTAFTAYWEIDGFGEGTRVERPPGRLYVHDPQVFALFDLIGRDLNFQNFDTRPILLYVMGARDTTVEVTATKLGTETIQWGGASFPVNKISLGDGSTEIVVWVDERGRMLRLRQASTGLEVLRDAPPLPKARKSKRG